MAKKPSWIETEAEADRTPGVANPGALKRKPTPHRIFKGIRAQPSILKRFDALVAAQKYETRKTGPELIEEAIEDLLAKYDNMTSS